MDILAPYVFVRSAMPFASVMVTPRDINEFNPRLHFALAAARAEKAQEFAQKAPIRFALTGVTDMLSSL